jgi:hypothetical protein
VWTLSVREPNHHDIERHSAVDRRNAVGLQDQDRAGLVGQMRDCGLRRPALPERGLVAQDPQGVAQLPVGRHMGVAEKSEIVVGEEAQQRRPFAVPVVEAVGVGMHLGKHRLPVGDGGAHVSKHVPKLARQLLAASSVGAVELYVDDRLRLALADRLNSSVVVAYDLDDRVEQPVDSKISGGNGSGNAVDEERHVLVDGNQPHPAAPGFATGRFDADSGGPWRADRGGGGDELGGLALLLAIESHGFAGKRIRRQRGADGVDQRLRQARLGGHVGNCSDTRDGGGL